MVVLDPAAGFGATDAAVASVTSFRYTQLLIDSEMNMSYQGQSYENITDSRYFSGGSSALAWLCLRLALHSRLSLTNALPLILDEATVYFDDNRLRLMMSELEALSEQGKQIIILSASDRELKFLKNASITELS